MFHFVQYYIAYNTNNYYYIAYNTKQFQYCIVSLEYLDMSLQHGINLSKPVQHQIICEI